MRRTTVFIASLILLIAVAGHAQARVAFPFTLDQSVARMLLSVGASFTPAVAYLFREDRTICFGLAAVSVLCLALAMFV